MGALLWGLVRLRRETQPATRMLPEREGPRPSLRLRSGTVSGVEPWIVEGAIAAWLAFVAEGFFEFNFGTSPVLMVFLFVVSVPFARGRADPRIGPTAAGNQR